MGMGSGLKKASKCQRTLAWAIIVSEITVCPYMLLYSALHIMQWFSHILDVFTPKIRWKFFDLNIFMNQNKRRLHKTWSNR